MLFEPEASMVAAWVSAGNAPQRIPFGVSGKVWSFAQVARQSGAWGAFRRYGGEHVPPEAIAYIAIGALTVAQARVSLTWRLLMQHGPMSAKKMGCHIGLHYYTARKACHALVEIGGAQILAGTRYETFRAIGAREPTWTDWLLSERRAA